MAKSLKLHWKRLRRVALVLGVGFLILWAGADVAIRVASSGRVYSKATVGEVPSARAAVVLGCSRTVRGGLVNLYYQRRIRAAADLYAARCEIRPPYLGFPSARHSGRVRLTISPNRRA